MYICRLYYYTGLTKPWKLGHPIWDWDEKINFHLFGTLKNTKVFVCVLRALLRPSCACVYPLPSVRLLATATPNHSQTRPHARDEIHRRNRPYHPFTRQRRGIGSEDNVHTRILRRQDQSRRQSQNALHRNHR